MKRSRYGGIRTPRTKKIRNPIRVRERIAKKGGRCAGCKGRYETGAEITSVVFRRRVFHRHTCVPANVGMMPTAGAGPILNSAASVASAMSTTWSAGEAALVGLAGLENILVVRIRSGITKITPEIEKSFDRYNKLKASTMHVASGGQTGASDQEKKQAMRLAVLELVKLVF